MQLLLPWTKPRLSVWERRPIDYRAYRTALTEPDHDLTEATLAVEPVGLPVDQGPFERLEAALFRYDIFGPKVGRRVVRHEPLEHGDTLGLEMRLRPALGLFFGSRVDQVFHRQTCSEGVRSGFLYRTITGHPLVGEETFEVVKRRDGTIIVRLEAWSLPNRWFVKALRPAARALQRWCAGEAVAHLARSAAEPQENSLQG